MPRYPLTEEQALILVRLINKKQPTKRNTDPIDMVILAQVGAIKMIEGKLDITMSGKKRFVKWAKKQQMIS